MSAAGDPPERAPWPRAVALSYDRREARDEAPRVVARGQGRVAEAMLALARQHGVPVREDPDLLALLSVCDVGAEIPTELYTAVAELLAWLYRANGELAEGPAGDA